MTATVLFNKSHRMFNSKEQKTVIMLKYIINCIIHYKHHLWSLPQKN